ncbi:hypothetical protein [Xylophilus sp. ASV27]|uniref:hypothetical protein n=1 Tax=Xylophilus sp. ASV27 TaxID=2795129 RepID=UPI001E5B14E8|nr:hypothetical protein [Xylophilus sp. ASV27]
MSQARTASMATRLLWCLGVMAASLLATAHAQEITEVPWVPMREVVFDSTQFPSTGTEEDRAILKQIWAKELAAPRSTGGGQTLPAFALIGDVRQAGRRVVFTFFAAARNDRCEPPENGADATNIYSLCSMRVTPWPMQGHKIADLPGYCMVYAAKRDKNRVEYAFDSSDRVLRLRTIQFGKEVPACSRALKLG